MSMRLLLHLPSSCTGVPRLITDSYGQFWLPRALRASPVDTLEQHRQLGAGDVLPLNAAAEKLVVSEVEPLLGGIGNV